MFAVFLHEFRRSRQRVELRPGGGEEGDERRAFFAFGERPAHLERAFGGVVDGLAAVAHGDRRAVAADDGDAYEVGVEAERARERLIDARVITDEHRRAQRFVGRDGIGLRAHAFFGGFRQLGVDGEGPLEFAADVGVDEQRRDVLGHQARDVNRRHQRQHGDQQDGDDEASCGTSGEAHRVQRERQRFGYVREALGQGAREAQKSNEACRSLVTRAGRIVDEARAKGYTRPPRSPGTGLASWASPNRPDVRKGLARV